jgi:DNA-binding response OmpR family regulator
MMPGRPVRELIDEFRRTHGGLVLICSGHAPAETGISLELADDFLPKPFKGEELVRKIGGLLDGRRSARAAVP